MIIANLEATTTGHRYSVAALQAFAGESVLVLSDFSAEDDAGELTKIIGTVTSSECVDGTLSVQVRWLKDIPHGKFLALGCRGKLEDGVVVQASHFRLAVTDQPTFACATRIP